MMKRARIALIAFLVVVPWTYAAAGATAGGGRPVTLSLAFQSQGTLARVAVRPGDHVRAGQLLAQLDASQARIGVETAEAGLLDARAARLHLTVRPSRAERAQNRVTLEQAKVGVAEAVRARADGTAIARRTLAQKRHALAQARLRLTIAEAASEQSAAALQGAVDTASAQLTTATATADNGAVRVAQEVLTNAVNAQSAAMISSRGTIADATGAVKDAANDLAGEITSSRATAHQANAAVKTARLAVRATIATVAVAGQRPRADAFVQARAGIRTAQANLAAARLALAQTELRAPAAGTVVAVNGHVGESPGQAGAAAGASTGFITMITFDSASLRT